MKEWEKYEKFIAQLCSEEYNNEETTVIPNAKITGKYSKVRRQIDVLIESRVYSDRERRILVDAKKHKRKVNIKDIEEFEGMMNDCSASRGILVCPTGYTKAAKRRAMEHIYLKLVTINELENLNLNTWDECLNERCDGRKSRGLLLWDSFFGIFSENGPATITAVAKCDECGSFHIWCCGCGKKFSIDDIDEAKCDCDEKWFWLTAIEEEIDVGAGELAKCILLLFVGLNKIMIVDRRPLT